LILEEIEARIKGSEAGNFFKHLNYKFYAYKKRVQREKADITLER